MSDVRRGYRADKIKHLNKRRGVYKKRTQVINHREAAAVITGREKRGSRPFWRDLSAPWLREVRRRHRRRHRRGRRANGDDRADDDGEASGR